MQSSNIRGKAAFVPWLAALVFGAAANTGWLLHELRHDQEPTREPTELVVKLELDSLRADSDPDEERLDRSIERRKAVLRRRAQRRAGARHTHSCELDVDSEEPEQLSAWIDQDAAYAYTIDRRVLDYFAPRGLTVDRPQLAVLASALDLTEPIELRNIRGGTPLWALGLRNGDRLLSLRTVGEAEVERVIVGIERRGRAVALTYELV